MSLDSKHAEARFLPNVTDSLYLLVAHNMTIFVLTTITTTTRPITLPLAHARGVIIKHGAKSITRITCTVP